MLFTSTTTAIVITASLSGQYFQPNTSIIQPEPKKQEQIVPIFNSDCKEKTLFVDFSDVNKTNDE